MASGQHDLLSAFPRLKVEPGYQIFTMFACLTEEERNASTTPLQAGNNRTWDNGKGSWRALPEVPSDAPDPDPWHPGVR